MLNLIDCHVHLEKGPYSVEWVNKFVSQAQKRNIQELYILEHTHRFREFSKIYERISSANCIQKQWFSKKQKCGIINYLDLIEVCKKEKFPINVKFGLEVCYEPQCLQIIENIKNWYSFDFLVGSIHWVDNFVYDISKDLWKNRNIDDVYQRYYELMLEAANCKVFNGLTHPDAIKCFGYYPSIDMEDIYIKLAETIKSNNIYVEDNAGLRINYNHPQLGMSSLMRAVFKQYELDVKTASDAHKPIDVGLYIKDLHEKWR